MSAHILASSSPHPEVGVSTTLQSSVGLSSGMSSPPSHSSGQHLESSSESWSSTSGAPPPQSSPPLPPQSPPSPPPETSLPGWQAVHSGRFCLRPLPSLAMDGLESFTRFVISIVLCRSRALYRVWILNLVMGGLITPALRS